MSHSSSNTASGAPGASLTGPPASLVQTAFLATCVAVSMIGWGWAWVGIRAAVRDYEPGPLALGRYLVASLVLLPLWLRRGLRWPARRDLPAVLAMGVLGFTLYNLCINAGEKTVTAGTAALIASAIPVLLTLGGRIFFGEPVAAVFCATGYGLLSKRLIARYRSLDVTTWAIWSGTLGLAAHAPGLAGVCLVNTRGPARR